MNLVIVETPAQAKGLASILGEGWRVEPCYGVVRDLPDDRLGTDIEADFQPTFVIPRGKGSLVRRLVKAVRESDTVYAALPPGRMGEWLAWHVLSLSADAKDKPVYRVSLPALTSDVIRAAFASPRPLNPNWIEAELAAHIINHLVEHSIKAALKHPPTVSYDAMIALRLLANHHHIIEQFTASSRWQATVRFALNGEPIMAQVLNAKGLPLAPRSPEQAAQLETLLNQAAFWVDRIEDEIKASPALYALNGIGLLEAAASELGLSAKRTLALVSTLYEVGWITYPLADAAEEMPDAIEAARAFIRREYGADYLLPDPRPVGGIAPADVTRVPEVTPGDGAALYALIWRRWIAAQMAPAQLRITTARIRAGVSVEQPYPVELSAEGRTTAFDGWQRVLGRSSTQIPLPPLAEKMVLQPVQVRSEAVAAQPDRCTELALVWALSQIGIALPAAVQAVDQLQQGGYATLADDALMVTERGRALAAQLTEAFSDLLSVDYRARLAAEIESIATGEQSRATVLRTFWTRFGNMLKPLAPPDHKPIILRLAEET